MATTEKSKSSENELAKVVEKSLPFLDKHGNTLLLAVAGVLALAALIIFATKWSSTGGDDQGWAMISAANATEDYAKIAEDYPGTNVGMWAKLIEADSYQQSAVQLSFTDREASRNELERAKKQYDELLKMTLPREIEEKALFGLAKCAEIGCDGDTGEAIAAYEAVVAKFEDSIYKDSVEQRVADLKRADSKEFYTFWGAQNPKPGDRIPPSDTGASPFGSQSVTLPETPLLLQQPGFNPMETSSPEPPDFEPSDGANEPIEPMLEGAGSNSGDASDAGEMPEGGEESEAAETTVDPEAKMPEAKKPEAMEPETADSEEPAPAEAVKEKAAPETEKPMDKPAAEAKPSDPKPEDPKPESATAGGSQSE